MEHTIANKTLKFRRVSYAKPGTPENLREYSIMGIVSSPVGTLSEIFDMIEAQNLDVNRLEFTDKIDSINFNYELKDGVWNQFVI